MFARVAITVIVAAVGVSAFVAIRTDAAESTHAATTTKPPRDLVFTQYTDQGTGSDSSSAIYVARTDGTRGRRLTEDEVDGASTPRWSPDGSKIAYTDYDAQVTRSIYIMNADGSDKHRIDYPNDVADGVAWSPDGRQIAFASYAPVGEPPAGIWIIDVEGRHLRRVRDLRKLLVSQVGNLDWSPDGKRIVFDAYPGPWIVNRDGTGLKQITRSGTDPRWSPDGKRLLSIGGYGQRAILVFARDRWKTPIRTFRSDSGMLYTATWSDDGSKIASIDEHGTLHVLDLAARRDIRRSFGSSLCARRSDHWCLGFDWKHR